MKYEPVIGIEVHVELNTKSKMFCRCPADYFGRKPNTYTCPVCLGLPGSLPYVNEEAIKKCIQIGLALNCEVANKSLFERKNYFYPDLPKGYQISQYQIPLCKNGWLEVRGDKRVARRIRVNRVHQEEDTGKLIHVGGETLIDFNRSGVPLVEIVTEPDFTNPQEVKEYAGKLQQIFRYLQVSNADMERGDMRLEANVSLREIKNQDLPKYRVELKNINSFRFMVAAIEYEIKRQIEALERGEKLTQETRGWDETKHRTYIQRTKEEAQDYRYFPEPDIPPIIPEKSQISILKSKIPELPDGKKERFTKQYGLREDQAFQLIETRAKADFYEEVVRVGKEHGISPTELANVIINKSISWEKILPAHLIEAIVKGRRTKGKEGEIEKAIKEVLTRSESAVASFKKGKTGILEFLVGQVLHLTKGQGNPQQIREKLLAKLGKRA